MGYIKADSLMSLFASSGIAAILYFCVYSISKGCPVAFNIVVGLLIAILLFFGYRFYLSKAFMPAGMMTLVTFATLGYLISKNCCTNT